MTAEDLLLADPRVEGKFPIRGLYQALAVASMCIQEQAAGRPLIRDVVTALSYLANQPYDASIASGPSSRSAAEKDDYRSKDERGGTLLRSGSGQKWNLGGFEMEDSPRENTKMLNQDLERERAVAEARCGVKIGRQKGRVISMATGSN